MQGTTPAPEKLKPTSMPDTTNTNKAKSTKVVTKVINMSSYSLSNEEIHLLKKGLKFTPTPKSDLAGLEKDVKEFCRRLRLKEYFYESDENDTLDEDSRPLARNKSNWNPKPKRNKMLDSCIDSLTTSTKELSQCHIKPCKDNLSKEERIALKQLQNNKDIVIKEADKGGAICIMDKTFYAQKMSDLLTDDSTYELIGEPANSKIISKIKKLAEDYQHCLKKEEIDYITNFEYKESNLYGLPKIHKSNVVKKAVNEQNSEYVIIKAPEDLKFRPIVAGPVSPTSRLSHLIDCIIKNLPQHTKSYVRDDLHFLSRLERNLPRDQEYQLVTLDVESLYTNIEKDLGITAIKHWLQKLKDKYDNRFSEGFICEAIQIVLDNNIFHFDNKHYLQIKGTAMGTKMAPTYANLVLAYVEEQLYGNVHQTRGGEYSHYVKENFLRYLDDCFIIWPVSKWSLNEFTNQLNDLHPSLRFTQEIGKDQIAFLDILVKLKDHIISTDIYYKPTDTHQYLHFKSCHPRHIKQSLPYSQARRLCTIIDDTDSRDRHLEEMKHFFLSRGYPQKLIDDGIEKAISIPISILRQSKEKNQEDVLPYVFTHNPHNPDLTPLVKSTLETMNYDVRMKKVLSSTKYITSRRQPPNLKNILTKACFKSTLPTNEGGSESCHDKRCGTCPHIQETKTIKITATGRSFNIRTRMNCKTKNVLYIITCTGCKEQYVGMTNDKLTARVRVHKSHIKNPQYRKLGVSKHIAECSNMEPKFNIAPFFKISESTTEGLIKEEMFIKQFQPSLNNISL